MELKFEAKYINTDGTTTQTLKIDIALGHGIGALEISIIIIVTVIIFQRKVVYFGLNRDTLNNNRRDRSHPFNLNKNLKQESLLAF